MQRTPRRRFVTLAALVAAVLFPSLAQGQATPVPPGQFTEVPGERLFSGRMIARPIQPREAEARGIAPAQREALVERAVAEMARVGIDRHFPEVDEYLIRVPAGETENTLSVRLMATGAFQYVEPDWILFPIGCPNDSFFGSQWHHAANRLASCAAWDIETGSPTVIVGICDTGVRTTHQDLLLNRVQGYHVPSQKWESQGGPINDINGHGTLCTGSAAANGFNGVGVSGMGWNIGHRMLRVTDSSDGSASLSNLTLAARRSAEFGDKVASVSYSGVNNSSVFTTGTYVRSLGALLVWAAGNSNINLNGNREDDVIVVGATDQNDAKASFSNYGPLVDLVAPGVSILTTSNAGNTSYAYANGTSFATPIVAGLCALIWSRNPDLTPAQVENIIRSTCKDLGAAGVDNIFGYGRIVSSAALAATPPPSDTTPPAPPTGLTATPGNARVDLAWNASPEPDLAGYWLQRSTNGGAFVQLNSTLLTGTTYADTGLVNGWTYTYRLFAQDTSGNVSGASASVSATPTAPPSQQTLFQDGFESGNLTAGNWVVQNSNAFASIGAAFLGSYGARLRSTTWMERSINTTGMKDITISYARRTTNLLSGQWLFVEWWNGSSWVLIEQTNATAWQQVTFTLPSGANNNPAFKIRYRLNSNSTSRRGDVDVVQVIGTPI